MKNYDHLIGKTVYGITGPGQRPNKAGAESVGEIVKIDFTPFGTFAIIIWQAGFSEGRWDNHTAHSIKTAGVDSGVGVYID